MPTHAGHLAKEQSVRGAFVIGADDCAARKEGVDAGLQVQLHGVTLPKDPAASNEHSHGNTFDVKHFCRVTGVVPIAGP